MHFYLPFIAYDGVIELPLSEHMISMRVTAGQTVTATDLNGTLWTLNVIDNDKKRGRIRVAIPKKEQWLKKSFFDEFYPNKTPSTLLLAQIDKNYMEKLVETLPFANYEEVIIFGSDLSPKQNLNLPRLEKILIRSSEQAQILFKPKLTIMEKANIDKALEFYRPLILDTLIQKEYMTDSEVVQNSHENKHSKNAILIGPEGGFSKRERELFQQLNLQTRNLGKIVYPAWLCPLVYSMQSN